MTEDGEGEIGHEIGPEDFDTSDPSSCHHEETSHDHGHPQTSVHKPHAGNEERYQHIITYNFTRFLREH